jgi:Mrp family chromosome partitioning ATPase
MSRPEQPAERYPAMPPQSEPPGDAPDLRAYLAPIWRWKWVIVAITVLAAGATYALTVHEAKTYTSTARLLVQSADPAASVASSVTTGQSLNAPTPEALANVATQIAGQVNTASVYRQLGGATGSAGAVVATPESTSSVIDVSASSHSAALAARLANTYVSVFLASQSQSVSAAATSDVTAARATLAALPGGPDTAAQRDALLTQIAQYNTIARSPLPGAQVVDAAVAPTAPSAPKPVRNAILAAVVGLLLGIGLVFLLDLADRRLVRVSTVESLYGRSVVAVLPHMSAAASPAASSFRTPPEFIEVMRSLRVNVRLAMSGQLLKSVLVTSALPGEGKSTVVRDLAFAHADAGERVLVVDCDLRRPSVARMFGIDPALGLTHVLRHEVEPAATAVTVFRTNPASSNGSSHHAMATGDPRMHGSIDVIAHGERVESPGALLSSKAMTDLLAMTTAQYDVVILDTSPILTVSDAVPLLDQVGAVLFLARLGVTTREAAERLTDLGRRVPAMNLVGIVVNDMRGSYVDEGYGYYSKYGYAYGNPDAAPTAQAAQVYAPLAPEGPPAAVAPPSPSSSPSPAEAQSTATPFAPALPYDPATPYDAGR